MLGCVPVLGTRGGGGLGLGILGGVRACVPVNLRPLVGLLRVGASIGGQQQGFGLMDGMSTAAVCNNVILHDTVCYLATMHTLYQKQRIFPRNALECIWEQVPWPINFRRRFDPPPFGNF
jgi:hypothetical protein